MKRMILGAALLAAAPLRAGEAAWLSSADRGYVIQVPADWLSAAAVPGLTPKGIQHVFSLAPRSRAFVLDIAAENAQDAKAVCAEDIFARARKLAGNPPARRAEMSDNSLFEYFRSTAAVKGRAGYRVQGVLHKYIQRYYLTFSSARGYPGDKEWKEAMQVLATLEPDDPSMDGWTDDFLKKVSGGAIPGQSPAPAAGSLKFTAAARADGTGVSFEEIEIFGCNNFGGNLYLFNKDRTAHCWIATLEDYKVFLAKLDDYNKPVFFQDCPEAMRQEQACDPEKLRGF